MTLDRERLWRLREEVHAIADRIAEDDREFAEPLYQFCDELDWRRYSDPATAKSGGEHPAHASYADGSCDCEPNCPDCPEHPDPDDEREARA